MQNKWAYEAHRASQAYLTMVHQENRTKMPLPAAIFVFARGNRVSAETTDIVEWCMEL